MDDVLECKGIWMRHFFKRTLVAGTCSTIALSAGAATPEEKSFDDLVLYGFDNQTKTLVRQHLADGSFETIGSIHLTGGTVITEIGSLAYVPGRLHLYGVWNYLGTEDSKLLKINIFTGEATPCANGTGFGNVQGLAASHRSGHNVDGQSNINPSNGPNNEFTLTLPDGSVITRDDLHRDYDGYTGPATSLHFKPKGNGNDNSLTVNGEVVNLSNANIYDLEGDELTVNVYNDHIVNGRAMGHWWIGIEASGGNLTSTGDDIPESEDEWVLYATHLNEDAGSELICIDPADGTATSVMALTEAYGGLAQCGHDDGQFYAAVDSSVYLIDVAAATETPVGEGDYGEIDALSFALGIEAGTVFTGVDPLFTEAGALFGFSELDHTLVLVHPGTGATLAIGAAINSTNLVGMIPMLEKCDPDVSMATTAFD